MTLTGLTSFAQSSSTWISFWNRDSTLVGFKDVNGIIKIEPKFQGFTRANKFDDIMAVTEEINDKWHRYYLTKSGRIVGKDSLHIFDNGADCESEGYIRFRDRKSDKAGMFNRNGDIVIPAIYNDLTRVRNGMITALAGAMKKQWGEHYSWQGGKTTLIDTNNKILIDDFTFSDNINFFSVLISPQPTTDSTRQNFKGVNGQYYSFTDFNKEFQEWLKSSFLNNLTKNKLLKSANKEITYWKKQDGWTSEPTNAFIERNFELLKTTLLELNSKDSNYNIFSEGLNPYIYECDEYKKYFNNCGESKDWLYPIKTIVINYKDKKVLQQDHFEFLRTNEGYKLISVSIRKGVLK